MALNVERFRCPGGRACEICRREQEMYSALLVLGTWTWTRPWTPLGG